jgi:hypothetical protein
MSYRNRSNYRFANTGCRRDSADDINPTVEVASPANSPEDPAFHHDRERFARHPNVFGYVRPAYLGGIRLSHPRGKSLTVEEMANWGVLS